MIAADFLPYFRAAPLTTAPDLFVVSLFGTARPGINRVRFRIFDLCSFPCRVGIRPA